jgi:hypothetical protein
MASVADDGIEAAELVSGLRRRRVVLVRYVRTE